MAAEIFLNNVLACFLAVAKLNSLNMHSLKEIFKKTKASLELTKFNFQIKTNLVENCVENQYKQNYEKNKRDKYFFVTCCLFSYCSDSWIRWVSDSSFLPPRISKKNFCLQIIYERNLSVYILDSILILTKNS